MAANVAVDLPVMREKALPVVRRPGSGKSTSGSAGPDRSTTGFWLSRPGVEKVAGGFLEGRVDGREATRDVECDVLNLTHVIFTVREPRPDIALPLLWSRRSERHETPRFEYDYTSSCPSVSIARIWRYPVVRAVRATQSYICHMRARILCRCYCPQGRGRAAAADSSSPKTLAALNSIRASHT